MSKFEVVMCDHCWVRLTFILIAIGFVAAGTSSYAASEGTVTIRVNYIITLDRLRPDPLAGIVTNVSLSVVLSGQKNVDEKSDVQSGRFTRQRAALRVLGEDKGWHVLGPKQLVKRIEYAQNRTIMTITVIGDKSCQVTVRYELKPGYRDFTLPGTQKAFYSRPRVIGSSCQIE